MRGFPRICCYYGKRTIKRTLPNLVAALSLFLSLLTTGWVSIWRPTSSARNLTTGQRLRALSGPPSGGRMREETFPPLAVKVADDGGITCVTFVDKLSDPSCILP